MTAILLALGSSVGYGVSDFLASLAGPGGDGPAGPRALTAERPSGPQTAGAALAVLGTLVVAAAQAAG